MTALRRLSRVYHASREKLMHLAEHRHGIRTARRVELGEVGMDAPGRIGYEPSPVLALRRALRGRTVGPGDVFLDLGCGKGRVLVVAAQLPFDRVIGVELVPELAEQARENLARVELECGGVEVVCTDALAYAIPDDVTVIYLYNPFQGSIFQRVLDEIVASLERAPRALTLVYRSPFEHEAVIASGRFELAREHRGLVPGSVGSALRIYESIATAARLPAG